jgi:SpoVK/Ycf46/Vps4 family AAA+-type ATPase
MAYIRADMLGKAEDLITNGVIVIASTDRADMLDKALWISIGSDLKYYAHRDLDSG